MNIYVLPRQEREQIKQQGVVTDYAPSNVHHNHMTFSTNLREQMPFCVWFCCSSTCKETVQSPHWRAIEGGLGVCMYMYNRIWFLRAHISCRAIVGGKLLTRSVQRFCQAVISSSPSPSSRQRIQHEDHHNLEGRGERGGGEGKQGEILREQMLI